MIFYESVLDQNNMTVALLRDEDFSHAIVESSEALQCLRRCESALHDLPTNKDYTGALDQCLILSAIGENMAESGKPFIFDHGILLPLTMTDYTTISAILIFNSALSHQLWATQNPAYAPGYLMKARQLYHLAYRMEDVEHNVMFQIAIINNMVVIERSLGNEADSKKDFDLLLSLWILLLDLGYGPRLYAVRGFIANGPWIENASAA